MIFLLRHFSWLTLSSQQLPNFSTPYFSPAKIIQGGKFIIRVKNVINHSEVVVLLGFIPTPLLDLLKPSLTID